MLTREEQEELDALEAEAAQPSRAIAAPQRTPGDLTNVPLNVLSPDEEAELALLEGELNALPQNQEKSFLSQVGDLATQAGEAIDSVTGAPARKAVGTFQDTKSLRDAGAAFIDQFGANPDLAPTGKEIAEKAGFSSKNEMIPRNPLQVADEARAFKRNVPTQTEVYSPAGVVGVGLDITLDPTNLLPFVGQLKLGQKLGKGASVAMKGSAKAVDMTLGTPLVRVGEATVDTAKAVAESTKKAKIQLSKMFRPEIAADYNELSQIAAKNNIPNELLNEAIEFGENSMISRHARTVAEGPLGGDALAKHERLVQSVTDATENNIMQIGKTNSIADDVQAGQLIRESFDTGVDNFFKQMGETYNSAIQMAPEMGFDKKSARIVEAKLSEMEKWAKGRLGSTKHLEETVNTARKGSKELNSAMNEMVDIMSSTNKAITKTQRSQAQEVLNAVELAKKALAESGNNIGQAVNAMRDIGEIAFKSKNTLAEVPSDIRKFQDMYFSLQKGVTESIRTHLGDEFADALIKNNSEMTKFFTKRGQISDIIGSKNLADEKVFQSLIMNGDTKKLDSLFSIISPEAKNQLKASFLNNTLVRNADGIINFASSRKKLNGLKASGKLKALLTVDEMAQLDEILKLGDRAGIGIMSTSGTGASNSFRNIVNTLQDKVAGDTLIDGLKRKARSNYVETTGKTADGMEYVQKIKAPEKAKPKSGIQLLRENIPVTKRQSAQAAKANSIQERNERLEQFKRLRRNK